METGKILQGRYEILKPIGFGGMADVYLARDILLDRQVAVKVLKDQFLKDKKQLAQFEREAKSAARLIHPSIINIYDVCEEEGIHYIVMEYVQGITLKAYEEQKGRLELSQTVSIAAQLAAALQHAHRHNIIHCDIKPQNILLAENMVPKIVDFGISRMVSDETVVFNANVVGSVHYFSPEQAKGEQVTAQSDIYSLGVVLYEMITGHVPFDGSTALAVARMHIEADPKPLTDYVPDVPPKLQEIINKALAKHLSDRYQTADEMRRDLLAVKAELIGDKVSLTQDYGSFAEAKEIENPVPAADFSERDATRVMKPITPFDPKKAARKRKLKKIATYLLSAFIVLCVLIGGYFWYTTPNIVVPNVVGMTVVEAQKTLEEAGFKIKLEEAYDANVTPGTVMKQDPKANTTRKSGSEITITICRGLELLKVPNVVGSSYESAKQTLAQSGFTVGTVTKTWDDSKTAGQVLKQSPKPDSRAPKNSPIDLVINEQEEAKPKKVAMPGILGTSLDNAQSKLNNLGLSVAEIKTVDSSKPANTVIAVTPETGAEVSSDSKIVLTVSSGKEPAQPAANSQYVEFVVPGSGEHNVQITVSDSQKQWVAVSGKYKGGTRVRQKISASGPAKIYFYVDQKLIEEKSM